MRLPLILTETQAAAAIHVKRFKDTFPQELMPLEIEVKARADDLERVEADLRRMGAQFVAEMHETDTYFNHPSRHFAETDEALRIRVSNDHFFLTYKGPKIDTQSKTREEIEVSLKNVDDAIQLLMKLGFSPVADVRKVRRLYTLDEFTICLDTVATVGTFVEVETKGEPVKELRDAAIAILDNLGLASRERKSYLELLQEKHTTSGLPSL